MKLVLQLGGSAFYCEFLKVNQNNLSNILNFGFSLLTLFAVTLVLYLLSVPSSLVNPPPAYAATCKSCPSGWSSCYNGTMCCKNGACPSYACAQLGGEWLNSQQKCCVTIVPTPSGDRCNGEINV